ncbi:hypothetical protein TWF970_005687 [Orbilia oligospora]|uniref:Uncharacterized protein n=1 Tax=Orbilia oligospora TaxID=2813651 RepID=A0A7C8VXX1_ORBOL|nr:hypothetical protein TWF970_005687 [Orbilia oligospora]
MMPTKITSNYPHWSRGASLREEPNPHDLVIDITDHPKITLFTDPAGQTNELAWEVNRALEDVFRVGRASATGENGWKCPLEYESHFVEDVNGRKVLQLAIKAAVNGATAPPEVATEFCQKLFTKEAFPLLSRVSYSGIFGISPRPGTVFESIWISSPAASALKERERLDRLGLICNHSTPRVRGRWLINICYALSIIFTFYQFGSWTAECFINCFGIHSIWDDPYMYAYSYHSRLIPPSVKIFRMGLFNAIYLILLCGFLFGPTCANDFEAKIRDKELYQKLEHLDWRKQCEDATKVADEVVCCLQQRRMGDPTNPIPSPTISTDYTIGGKLCTLLHLLPQLYHQNQEISHIHDQIQRNDQSLAKLYFIIAAIIASVFSWFGRLNATAPHSTTATIVIIVAGIISTVLFAVPGGYIAWRAEKRRSMVEKCGDVNNQILEVWRSVQRNYSYLVWVYATNHGTPRFTTEGLEKQWSEWVTDVDAANPNVLLNPEFSDQIGEFGRYLAAVQDEILI